MPEEAFDIDPRSIETFVSKLRSDTQAAIADAINYFVEYGPQKAGQFAALIKSQVSENLRGVVDMVFAQAERRAQDFIFSTSDELYKSLAKLQGIQIADFSESLKQIDLMEKRLKALERLEKEGKSRIGRDEIEHARRILQTRRRSIELEESFTKKALKVGLPLRGVTESMKSWSTLAATLEKVGLSGFAGLAKGAGVAQKALGMAGGLTSSLGLGTVSGALSSFSSALTGPIAPLSLLATSAINFAKDLVRARREIMKEFASITGAFDPNIFKHLQGASERFGEQMRRNMGKFVDEEAARRDMITVAKELYKSGMQDEEMLTLHSARIAQAATVFGISAQSLARLDIQLRRMGMTGNDVTRFLGLLKIRSEQTGISFGQYTELLTKAAPILAKHNLDWSYLLPAVEAFNDELLTGKTSIEELARTIDEQFSNLSDSAAGAIVAMIDMSLTSEELAQNYGKVGQRLMEIEREGGGTVEKLTYLQNALKGNYTAEERVQAQRLAMDLILKQLYQRHRDQFNSIDEMIAAMNAGTTAGLAVSKEFEWMAQQFGLTVPNVKEFGSAINAMRLSQETFTQEQIINGRRQFDEMMGSMRNMTTGIGRFWYDIRHLPKRAFEYTFTGEEYRTGLTATSQLFERQQETYEININAPAESKVTGDIPPGVRNP